MTKTYIHPVKLRKWFPPHDRFATCIARLCILREDFALGLSGLYTPHIKKLDSHSVLWRRTYFWRNLVKTLWEIRRTLETLLTVPEFKKLLNAQTLGWQKKFRSAIKKLEDDQVLIQKARDSLGGHVLHRTIEEVLSNLLTDKFGYIEIGPTPQKTHFKFAMELVADMVVAGVPEAQQESEIWRVFRTVRAHFTLFHLIETILAAYVDARKLLE